MNAKGIVWAGMLMLTVVASLPGMGLAEDAAANECVGGRADTPLVTVIVNQQCVATQCLLQANVGVGPVAGSSANAYVSC